MARQALLATWIALAGTVSRKAECLRPARGHSQRENWRQEIHKDAALCPPRTA